MKKIVLLEGPILRISFIKGSPDLLKIKKIKHEYTLNKINVKYAQVDLLRLKWRFLQRASDRPKSNAPCWQTLDRHLVIRHQKILLNVFRRLVIGAWSVSKKRLLNVFNNRVHQNIKTVMPLDLFVNNAVQYGLQLTNLDKSWHTLSPSFSSASTSWSLSWSSCTLLTWGPPSPSCAPGSEELRSWEKILHFVNGSWRQVHHEHDGRGD